MGSATRHYIDGIQYEGGTRVSVQGEEGRAVASGTTYVYEYYLKDHLGNTRMSIRRGTGNTCIANYRIENQCC